MRMVIRAAARGGRVRLGHNMCSTCLDVGVSCKGFYTPND